MGGDLDVSRVTEPALASVDKLLPSKYWSLCKSLLFLVGTGFITL